VTDAAAAVRDEVERALPSSRLPLTGWSAPRAREWSWHFDAVGGGGRLLVKVPRWEGVDTLEAALAAGPQEDTAGEFSSLQSVFDAVARSGDPGLAAVRPVAYVPAVNAIVLDRLDAVPLVSRLTWSTSVAAGIDVLDRVGRLLRLLHGIGGFVDAPFDGRSAAARLRERFAGGPAAIQIVGESVARMAERLDGRAVATGTIHGDFSRRNILVTRDDRVAAIDPNRYTGSAASDLAHLAAELVLGRSRLVTLGLVPGAVRVHRWVAALVDGYGPHDEAFFEYEWAVEGLARWIDLEQGRSGPAGLLVTVNRRLFRSEIARLVA